MARTSPTRSPFAVRAPWRRVRHGFRHKWPHTPSLHSVAAIYLLFDDLIRPQQQRRRNREAERLGGLEVDDEFELRGLLDR